MKNKEKALLLLIFLFLLICLQVNAAKYNFKKITNLLSNLTIKKENVLKLSDNADLNAKLIFSQKFSDLSDSNTPKLYIVQGFCCDDKYFYIATTSFKEKDPEYLDTETVLIKMNMTNFNIVKKKYLGKIGHSSSLTYNPVTKSIYIAPASIEMQYIVKVNDELENIEKIFLKKQDNSFYKEIDRLDSLSYNPRTNTYQIRKNNRTLSVFDSDFKFLNDIKLNYNCRINGKISNQVFTCDGYNYFSVCNYLKVTPIINYIVIYDLNGKHIKDLTLEKELLINNERVEFEQLAYANNNYYMLAQCKGFFRIYQLNLRKQ